MKRKLAIVLLLICAAALLTAFCWGKTPMEGRCLVSDNGLALIVDKNGSPIVLHNRSVKTDLLDGLRTGDKIWILHDGVLTTYPGSTGVYACWTVARGSLSDIPEDTLKSLDELGWKFE